MLSSVKAAGPIIADHTCTDLREIPEVAINQAKTDLHIAYGHTSHGSQLTTGMTGLVHFANGGGLGLSLPTNIFAWNNGGTGGALDLHDYAMGGDCGYYPQWVNNTRSYLNDPSHSDVNVIIWSWCGQASGRTDETMLSTYLEPMAQLELDYPDVTFIYMTGHADGSGLDGNLHLRNQQIRDYCTANNKVLYDYYDIECYNPDGNYFGDQWVEDDCEYYYTTAGGEKGTLAGNWATEWQNSHTVGIDWYTCSSSHSRPLNANRKAYAAWWLWARLAGWGGACLPGPSGLTAVPDSLTREIVLNWTDNSSDTDEDSFIIQRQVDGGAWDDSYATVAADTATYTDTGLAIGSYNYRVVAHLNDDGSGNPCDSSPSNEASADIVSTDPPFAPSGLGATGDSRNRSIVLTWTDNSENETGFIIQRRVNGGAWNNNYAAAIVDITTFNDDNLPPGAYTYRVAAYNDYGNSYPSNEAGDVILDLPPAPTSLQATGDSLAGTASLTWTDNSGNEDGFTIQRQVGGGLWNDNYDSVGTDVTSYLDNNGGSPPLPNGTYNYRVVAFNGNGESDPSNEASTVISQELPAAPSGLQSELNGFDITLTWNDNSDNEENVILERKIDSGNFIILDDTLPAGTETYLDSSLQPLHTYAYQVKARNNYGDSGYSDETSEYIAEESYTITLKQSVDEYTGCKDAYLDSNNPDTNYGGTQYKHVLNNPKCNFIISFDLPSEVINKKILDAKIWIYCWSVSSWQADQYLDLYRLTEEWEEGSTTWNSCTTPGGTHYPALLGSSLIPNSSYHPEFDITNLLQQWVDEAVPNYGVLLKNDSVVDTGIKSSEYSESKRPYLEITYAGKPPCPTDLDEDGDVDGSDLAAFAAVFDPDCLDGFAAAYGQ